MICPSRDGFLEGRGRRPPPLLFCAPQVLLVRDSPARAARRTFGRFLHSPMSNNSQRRSLTALVSFGAAPDKAKRSRDSRNSSDSEDRQGSSELVNDAPAPSRAAPAKYQSDCGK